MREHDQNEKNKAKEKIMNELLVYAANQEAERDEDNFSLDEEFYKLFQPSERFDKNMQRLIRNHRRKKKMKSTLKMTMKVATFFIIVTSIFLTAALSVKATRTEILNLFTETTKEYLNIKYGDRTLLDSENLFKDWEQIYLPEYIPEDFDIKKTERLIRISTVEYSNREGLIITYSYAPASSRTLSLDSEDATIKELTILGNPALSIQKNTTGIPENKIVFTNGEMSFYISSSYDMEKLIKMADSVRFIP